MGNFCSIFHARFRNLVNVIPSTRKAQLVDYILLGWQTSTYKLKGSSNKWFMKPYSEIVKETGIPESTLQRYIKELAEEGFIERRQALYSRTSEEGAFTVKKGNYIHVTEKLLKLIQPPKPEAVDSEPSPANNYNKITSSDNNYPRNQNKTSTDRVFSTPAEGINPLKMRESYIGDLHLPVNNTIIFAKSMRGVDKHTGLRLLHQFESVQTFLFSTVKEEVSDDVKKLVAGTFFNLTFVHHQNLSCPEQVVSEYLYALLNTTFYMRDIQCFKHRNNILSKLIRTKNWKTPKGFYNHFYLGQAFKKPQAPDKDSKNVRPQMEEERQVKDARLSKIEDLIFKKGSAIDVLMDEMLTLSNEELIMHKREQVCTLRKELEVLWEQQFSIEQEIMGSLAKESRLYA